MASEGSQALTYLLREGTTLPSVILLDLRMPVMDGREVLRRVREHPRTRHIPVVIVSTSSRPEDVESCYRLGANSFVVKVYNTVQPGRYLVEIAKYWLTLNRLP